MSIIESDVKEFIKRLPDLVPLSTHLVMLAARSRMSKIFMDVKIQDLVVERKVIRPHSNWRDVYFQKVYNLATLQQEGRYWYNHREKGELLIPGHCLALFGTLTPRDVLQAIVDINRDIDKQFVGLFTGAEPRDSTMTRLDVEFFGALHRHRLVNTKTQPERECSARKFTTVDLDEPSIYDDVRDALTPYRKLMTTRTSRGYHFVLELDKKSGLDFYQGGTGTWPKLDDKFNKGKEKAWLELQRDGQEPIPGTVYTRPDYKPGDKPNFVTFME